MRSTKNPDIYFSKSKKKPAVQKIIDNIDDYTIEDLENLKGTQFPKWVREELVNYKNRNGLTSQSIAEKIAAMMVAASQIK
jgi:hypothetical protein